ncbi:MAG: IS21 family transposase [Desulfotomaculaceae bacterium]|nr:IS21 family transposase [Desulfotomaculaceae bacterium]
MKGWPMYQEIQELKELGLKKAQAARKLQINRRTVDKYWDMTPDEFAHMKTKSKQRKKKLQSYEDKIVGWLKRFPDITAAEIHDWLKEHYPDYQGKERTLRRYVGRLRDKHNIKKPINLRQYQAVDELPMGYQAQVDLGQINLTDTRGKKVTLYGFGMVLSHSRYKYVEWDDKSLNTTRFIQMHYRAFEFMGGVPEEIVYDQDRLLAISENFGDIIYTAEFEQFRQQMGFRVYLCRKKDPESKGKIEAVIKYVKGNYARHRIFDNLQAFNEGCIKWLYRTANAEVHGTTKKVPAQVFTKERKHLKPIPLIMDFSEPSLTRAVRKDNTIWYLSNRYSVPLGTYRPGKELEVKENEGILQIWDPETGELLVSHELSLEKGKLIKKRNHQRDHSRKIAQLYDETLTALGGGDEAADFLDRIQQEKPRYVRDQYHLILNTARKYPLPDLKAALSYCLERQIYSAVDLRTITEYFNETDKPQPGNIDAISIPKTYRIKTEVRDISEYTAIYGGMED